MMTKNQAGTASALQRSEAIENARDVCSYLHKVFSGQPVVQAPLLSMAISRYVRFVWHQWAGIYPIPESRVHDVQIITGDLLSRHLTGLIRFDDPHYYLTMDRLSAMEAGRTGPAHRDRLFRPGELTELASQWERPGPLDFVTAVGLRCDCPMRVVFAVIHDGTPSAEELQVACSGLYGHACESLRFADPTTIGECRDAPGGVMGVTHDLIGRLQIEGLPVRGPHWYCDDRLWDWDPELARDQSEAA